MQVISIYERRDGRFEGRVYLGKTDSGRRKYKSYYGANEKEVIEKYAAEKTAKEPCLTKMTVKEMVREWLTSVVCRIKESTAANYRMKAEKHIIPSFGEIDCGALKSKDVYAFINSKLSEGFSARYISDIVVLLKSVMKYAAHEYGINNVTDGISMPKKNSSQVRLLTDREQTILKNHIDSCHDTTSLGAAFSLYMGMRIGEICALRWEDIDLEKRILTVSRTIQRIQTDDLNNKTKIVISTPKSESSRREIPIPERMMSFLREKNGKGNHYILTGSEKPLEPRSMQYRFARLLKRLGLPSVHFHSLRHSFSCQALASGFDIKTLSELLGHGSTDLTLKFYAHSSLNRKIECMKLIK